MAVTGIEITSRTLAGDGASFGDVGQYEFIRGKLHFAVDPRDLESRLITDIGLAPTGPDGKVHFSSDIHVLKPVQPRPGGSLLVDFCNRGNRSGMAFNSPPQAPVSGDPHLGNGFLMRHGFTVVFCGWQTDVPEGRIRLHAPEAIGPNGAPVTGRAYQQYDLRRSTYELPLSDAAYPGHQIIPAADVNEAGAVLTERDWPDGEATVIPRDRWQFARWVTGSPVPDGGAVPDSGYICMPSGFRAGKVYEITYTAVGPKVIGLGFLAIRDCASFFRHGSEAEGNPSAGSLDRAYAYGVSQTGRTVREFIYLGLNQDEAGRIVFDGMMAHTGSSRFGEFNIRFGQPSSNHLRNVGNAFAVTYTEELDPVTGRRDGLLRRLEERNAVPKIVASNSATEYWWTGASLSHTDALGTRDIPPPEETVRVYHLASARHAAGSLPLTDNAAATRQQHWANTLDYRPAQRAILLNLDRWVRAGTPPPPSLVPSIEDGTAVSRESLRPLFASIPGLGFLAGLPVRRRLDFGEEMVRGIPDYPPGEGQPYVTLVSSVDADGNEVAGLRLPDISVPLGSHTGWTLRHPEVGGAGHYIPLAGAVVPFSRTREERERLGDPRPSIEERYASRDAYLALVREAAQALVDDRYILEEDVDRIVSGAAGRWDAFHEVATLTPMMA